MIEENLFPIRFEGKEYFEKDCHYLFSVFYTCPEALSADSSVYVSDGLWVYPDGSTIDES